MKQTKYSDNVIISASREHGLMTIHYGKNQINIALEEKGKFKIIGHIEIVEEVFFDLAEKLIKHFDNNKD